MPDVSGRSIWVFLEQNNGAMEGVSLEVLGKSRELAGELGAQVTAVLLGHDVKHLAEEASVRGADFVLLADSPSLKDYSTEAYTKVVGDLVKERKPQIFLLGATHNGVDLAARLAIRLGAGMMAHVVELEIEKGTEMLLGSVPGFGGSIVAVCKCKKGSPQMATVRPGIFKALEPNSSKGIVEPVPVTITPEEIRHRVVEKSVGKGVDITRAERMVAAGLGCGSDLSMPQKLAEAIKGNLGVSRPLADKGIAPKDLVIGSTGYSLNSKLAVVVGVSGAVQFTSGIGNVSTVIAINSDRDAPIFKHADYCVVGDLFKILPPLIAKLESSGADQK